VGSKGGDAPATPDYSAIAQSDTTAATLAASTSADQLAWAKQQYADNEPYTQAYMKSMTDASNANIANATAAQSRYTSEYQPVEDQFVSEATNYNSPDQAAQRAGAGEADVASQYAGQRTAALSQLESYGIDPSTTRYAALDLGTRISQAAATAAAGTTSRNQSEATGLALQSEAINIGRGYPGQVAQSYSTAQGTGGAAVGAGNSTASTYGNLMGTPTQWSQLGLAGNTNAVGALNTGFSNEFSNYEAANQIGASNASGIGQLAGAAVMAGGIAI
jgi:hypothetical protein